MIEVRIETVPLQTVGMVDQRPAAAQFLDKDRIAQPLRRAQVTLAAGQTNDIVRLGLDHSAASAGGMSLFLENDLIRGNHPKPLTK